jgi:hypothetical protein
MGKKVVRKRLKELGLSAKVLACAHLRRRVLTLSADVHAHHA